MDKSKDENISNHEYINTSILWIYRIYRRHIDEYFRKKNICETKVWLILILMITKQGLELMTTF